MPVLRPAFIQPVFGSRLEDMVPATVRGDVRHRRGADEGAARPEEPELRHAPLAQPDRLQRHPALRPGLTRRSPCTYNSAPGLTFNTPGALAHLNCFSRMRYMFPMLSRSSYEYRFQDSPPAIASISRRVLLAF